MGDSFLAQKLAIFTDTAHAVEACHRPFVIDLDGQPWSVAVGGPWMYAVRGSSSYTAMEDVTELVPRLLRASPVGALEVETKKLKEWAGLPPPLRERTFEEGARPEGVIFGNVFDLRRLACLLEHVPFPKLVIWDATSVVGVRAVGLESRGKWRAFLAAVDADPEDQPVFDPRPEGAAAFDLMTTLPED